MCSCLRLRKSITAADAREEQTVKVLTDTWHPQNIPQVYLTGVRSPDFPEQPLFAQPIQPIPVPAQRNTQLPSPISPSIHAAPPHNATGTESGLFGTTQCNLVPLRNYVHEVLRRSRTSGGVLQTALCYLDAVRPRLDEVIDLEKRGFGAPPVPVLDEVIIQGTEADIAAASDEYNSYFTSTEELIPTVRVADESDPDCSMPAPTNMLHHVGTEQLPSPLLCPRRAFLAALILATKFTQDKCFSNRAWAKLSGLPPREVSRCERAMGDALGWRLWVGKAPVTQSADTRSAAIPVSASAHSGRSLSRCQTENVTVRSATSKFLVRPEDVSAMSSASALRRSATLPTGESVQRDAKWDARPAQQTLHPVRVPGASMLAVTNVPAAFRLRKPARLSLGPIHSRTARSPARPGSATHRRPQVPRWVIALVPSRMIPSLLRRRPERPPRCSNSHGLWIRSTRSPTTLPSKVFRTSGIIRKHIHWYSLCLELSRKYKILLTCVLYSFICVPVCFFSLFLLLFLPSPMFSIYASLAISQYLTVVISRCYLFLYTSKLNTCRIPIFQVQIYDLFLCFHTYVAHTGRSGLLVLADGGREKVRI